MSQLIGGAMPTQRTQANDNSLRQLRPRVLPSPARARAALGPGGLTRATFRTPWWPGSGSLGDWGADVGMLEAHAWGVPTVRTVGRNSRFGYSGVARDQFNSPVGSATVNLFLSETDTKVTESVQSAPVTGEFTISTQFYAPHWLYIWKSGAPDVGGVSVRTTYPNT